MSKRNLSKELNLMDAEQLRQVILDAYSVNRDFAAYFEYFLNPDPEALYEKAIAKLRKEIFRFKYGQTKARVSVIAREIKAFSSFQPGGEYEMRLLLSIISFFVSIEKAHYSLPATVVNGIARYIAAYFTIANKEGRIEKAIADFEKVVDDASDRHHFRRYLIRMANDTFEELKPPNTRLSVKE